MKKLAVAALVLSSLSGGAYAHEAGEFFIRAGSATVRPTEGSDNVLGLGGFNVSNNTQLGLTFTYMATDNIGVELLAAEALHAEALCVGVTTVAGGACALFVCHVFSLFRVYLMPVTLTRVRS